MGTESYYRRMAQLDRYYHPEPVRQPVRTVDQATPGDVMARAAAECKRLPKHIADLKNQLAAAEAQLVYWQSVPQS